MSQATIKKAKSGVEHTWNLEINGTVVGKAVANYKTTTQRVWAGQITVPVVGGDPLTIDYDCAKQDGNSVKSIITGFTIALDGVEVDIPVPVKQPKVRKVKSKYPKVLLRSDITLENIMALSAHYGYGVEKKDGVARTSAEQVKYVKQLLDRAATAAKKAPAMSDLVGAAGLGKDGEPEVVTTSLSDHYK